MLSCVSPHLLILLKKLFGSFNDTKMEGLLSRNAAPFSNRAGYYMKCAAAHDSEGKPQYERINIDGDFLSYAPDEEEKVGLYIAASPLSPENNYYEIEVVDTGVDGSISLGLCPKIYPLDMQPGCMADSVGFLVEDGRLYKGRSTVIPFGPRCECGDRIGCGVKFDQIPSGQDSYSTMVPVFFTRNGKELGTTLVPLPLGGLHPAIGMHSSGEEVRLLPDPQWIPEEDTFMSVDNNEEEWLRLHDIRLNGQVLEYTGRGKSIIDVGLAQAKAALNTTFHYYEIEIIDPGENCYIAIGLARRDYPKHRHPGWNKGSIAYHADDGKIFIGSGVGDPFGPRCHKGDRMGCGIIFPRDYICQYDSDGSLEFSPSSPAEVDDLLELGVDLSDSEDDDWWNDHNGVESHSKVQVFFTRNGKTIGKKDVRIPKGGFYPTIGMLSTSEKVRVDLHPLTG